MLTLFSSYPRQPWIKYINADNQPYATAEAIDLLDNLLRYDHMERLTAKEAQGHIYFSEFLFSASVILYFTRVSHAHVHSPLLLAFKPRAIVLSSDAVWIEGRWLTTQRQTLYGSRRRRARRTAATPAFTLHDLRPRGLREPGVGGRTRAAAAGRTCTGSSSSNFQRQGIPTDTPS